MKKKPFLAASILSVALATSGCSINFDALLRPFASDADACDKLSEIIEAVGESDNSYELLLRRIATEVTPLAEPELAATLRLLTSSASKINSEGSIFEGIAASLVSTEQIAYVLTRCIEVGVEVQYGR